MSKTQSRSFLVAVSNELAEIRGKLEDLAVLTTDLVADGPAERRADAISSVQAFDLLIQRLDGLSGLAAALGAGAPIATALHALTLSDLHERLAGEQMVARMAPASAGELTLFD